MNCESDENLQEALKKFYAVEENGVAVIEPTLSVEEERAQQILKATTRRIGN